MMIFFFKWIAIFKMSTGVILFWGLRKKNDIVVQWKYLEWLMSNTGNKTIKIVTMATTLKLWQKLFRLPWQKTQVKDYWKVAHNNSKKNIGNLFSIWGIFRGRFGKKKQKIFLILAKETNVQRKMGKTRLE